MELKAFMRHRDLDRTIICGRRITQAIHQLHLSSINYLEVLQLILRKICPAIAIPSRRNIAKYQGVVNITDVAKLLLVCQRWKDILMEDRAMWGTIFLDATKLQDDEDWDDMEKIGDKSTDLLHRYLEMSGSRGLELTIYGRMTTFEGNCEVLDQLVPQREIASHWVRHAYGKRSPKEAGCNPAADSFASISTSTTTHGIREGNNTVYWIPARALSDHL